MNGLTRRRFIAIAAVGFAGRFCEATAAAAPPAIWQGIALGAKAEIRIDGSADAAPIIVSVRREIDRLERLFSLYRADSAIARLNRDGVLAEPEPDFLALLSAAAVVHRATDGLFDPTVQPIWDAYARACGGGPIVCEDANGVIAKVAEKNRLRTGFEHVDFGPDKIVFRRPGMALTLNGIAQGYITNRVADLLIAHGLRHVLVDMGEIRALGSRRDGSGWPVHIPAGSGPISRRTILLDNRALATSAALGTTFDAAGHLGHILDPRTGGPLTKHRQVTIEAPSAAIADGLSTALCLMADKSDAVLALNAFPETRLHTMD